VEYVAKTHASKEAVWLKSFVKEIMGQDIRSLTIMADNQRAIALAKDNKFYMRTKHIDLRYHFIREAVESKKVEMKYILTSKNVADIFTKLLPKPKFQQFAEMLGLVMMKESE
jgi:hypothetical protein